MALIKCPECGREVSSAAVACIGCGYPIAANMAKNTETAPQSTTMASQNATAPQTLLAPISPDLRWKVLGVYCDDIAYLHYIVYMGQLRSKSYKEAFQKVKKAIADKIAKNGITLDEMLEYRKNGGVQPLIEERNKIRETPQYKKWNALNDRVGEINNQTHALAEKINEVNETIDPLRNLVGLKRDMIAGQQDLRSINRQIKSMDNGMFSKLKYHAREKEIANTINTYKAEAASMERQIAQGENEVSQLMTQKKALSAECDRVIEERNQYDAYYEKSRTLKVKIDGYEAGRKLMDDYLEMKQKMNAELTEMTKIIENAEAELKPRYALNIIPANYRNLQCMLWLSDYVGSSQPTDLNQLLALMSLQQINEQLKETNAMLEQIASNQKEQIESLNYVGEQVLQLRREQQEAKESYLAAIDGLCEVYMKEQWKAEIQRATMNATLSDIVSQIEESQRLSREQIRVSEEQLRECRNCANMLDSIQAGERNFQQSALNTLSGMASDTRFLTMYC